MNNPRSKGDPTRDIAYKALCRILMGRETLERAFGADRAVDTRDGRAAYRIAAETLRRLGVLRAVLEPMVEKEPPKGVEIVLLMGAAQLLFLDVPPHAALNTALELLERNKFGKFKGFANAVLRRIARDGQAVLEGLDAPRLDTPAWLWRAWGGDARQIAECHYVRAPLDVRIKPGHEELTARLAEMPGAVRLGPYGVRLPSETSITALEGFDGGHIWAQDYAASLIAPLLGDVRGLKVADLCAAPGGKAACLAVSGAQVTAVEKSPGRAKRLRENLERLRLTDEVRVEITDALNWRPGHSYQAVLLDAPCSATGTFRRNPDVPWQKNEADIRKLAKLQGELLARSADFLEPGGKLVYAACSLIPEEGPEQIGRAVESGAWKLDPIAPEEVPGVSEAVTPEGYLRTLPSYKKDIGGMDGFFAARLIRA